jgi:outer membrane autotransporter protein
LLNLITELASSSDPGSILDAVAGSTQAESQWATSRADDPWKQSVAQRVNAARTTGCTVAGDVWCFRQYAQAPSPVMTDAVPDSDPFAWLETGLRDVGATSLWARVVGVWGETDGDINSPASDHDTYGGIVGADHVFTPVLLVGVAGQYTNTETDFVGNLNTSSTEALQAGAYLSYGTEIYLNANTSIIGSRTETSRIFSVGPLDYNAVVNFDSFAYTASAELGAIYDVNGYRVEPIAAINYIHQDSEDYAEDGAGGLSLIVRPDDMQSLRSTAGVRLSRVYDIGDRKMVPELRFDWRHEYLDRRNSFKAAFAGDPLTEFLVHCATLARDIFAVGGSLTMPLTGRITGYLDAEGAFSEDTRTATVSLGARATW